MRPSGRRPAARSRWHMSTASWQSPPATAAAISVLNVCTVGLTPAPSISCSSCCAAASGEGAAAAAAAGAAPSAPGSASVATAAGAAGAAGAPLLLLLLLPALLLESCAR